MGACSAPGAANGEDEHAVYDGQISSAELVKAYQENEEAANKTYMNKVVTIRGPVFDFQSNGEEIVSLLIGSEDYKPRS